MKQFGSSPLPASSPWSTKVGGRFAGTWGECDWRPRFGEWSALLTGDIGREVGKTVAMVGIRRLNCRRRAARQPSSTRSAPSLAYDGRRGWERGRWERVRSSWLVKQNLEANTSDLEGGRGGPWA
jgi:hypothetical protein